MQKTTVIIIPGGGYDHRSARESGPVADVFAGYGYETHILEYPVAPVRYPAQIKALAQVISDLRHGDTEAGRQWRRIYLLGFSAGGHLAASYSMLWQELLCDDIYRPDGQILCYPVISSGKYAHRQSFINLLGPDASEELFDKLSVEKHVNSGVPRTFIWHCLADESVPAENSMLYAQALREFGIEAELHLFSGGRHGISLGTAQSARDEGDICPQAAVWTSLAHEWISAENRMRK